MKLLLAVDGTPASLAAVRHALALRAQGLQVDYVLVNVQAPPSLYEMVVAHDADRLNQVRRDAGADLLAAAEGLLEAAGAEWQSEVAGGDAGHVLVDLVETYACDAVIMGTEPGAPGPVARALIEHCPVPLTLVRAPAA